MKTAPIAKVSDLPPYNEVITSKFQITSEAHQYNICALRRNKTVFFLSETKLLPHRVIIKLAAMAVQHDWEIERDIIHTDASLIAQLNATNEQANDSISEEENSAAENLFYKICDTAVNNKASDIFIEHRPYSEKDNCVKMRIDGKIEEMQALSSTEAGTLIAVCYNTLSEEDSKSSEHPSFIRTTVLTSVIQIHTKDYNARLRMTSCPAHYKGTDMVFRLILEDELATPDLSELGYSNGHYEIIKRMASRTNGVLVFCGIPGSGKSTTIRSLLDMLRSLHPGKRIGMIEDPVEYKIDGVNQVSISDIRAATVELAWKAAIKGIVRANSDIMALGEVRDDISAVELVNYVLSGHQVLTTVHAESAIGCVPRLFTLGVSRDIIATPGFISGLVYQKLLPKLCQKCAIPLTEHTGNLISPELLKRLGKVIDPAEDVINLRNNEGCDDCRKGHKGRIVAVEAMMVDDTMRALIRIGDDLGAYKHWRSKYKRKLGHGSTAFDNAVQLMRNGIVSPHDVEAEFMLLDSEEN